MTDRITLDLNAPRTPVSPSLYGIFFEEINHAGEGGLYAEMVQNRDFEATRRPAASRWAGNLLLTGQGWYERKWFGHALHGWSLVNDGVGRGSFHLDTDHPLNPANPHALRVVARSLGTRFGVANDGYWGMCVRQGHAYDLTFYARTAGGERFDLTVSLETPGGSTVCARAVVSGVTGPWARYRCSLTAECDTRHGRLVMAVDRPGTLWLDVVSLFPRQTFRHRPNGLRPDLAGMLEALHPAFMRFPGGAIVGGLTLDNRIQWKHSVGDIATRTGTANLWGYYTTNGLGFHEYLQLCEDLGADALWVCNPGMADSYRHGETVTGDATAPFVQEALDAVEYALGPPDSEWGARRVANGREEPFGLRYVEIGNEAAGDVYRQNYLRFYRALRDAYPDLSIIGNEAYRDDTPVDIVDHHYYGAPEAFYQRHGLYDDADRGGPAVYVGEYGCTDGVGEGNLTAALAEAAFLIGLERNSDLVRMSSYAPLFYHVKDVAWPVNLIGFDNARAVGRSSYHVQKLFADNRPDEVVRTRVEGADLYALGGVDTGRGEIVLKVVNPLAAARSVALNVDGVTSPGAAVAITTLSHADPTVENSLDDPDVVAPVLWQGRLSLPECAVELPPHSLTVFRLAPVA